MHRLLLLALFVPLAAAAVPNELAHQGRLLDAAGAPLDGAHDLGLALYDAPSGGSPIWSETQSASFEAGYYAVVLGSSTPMDDALFDGGALWLELAVDGGAPLGRLPLSSVPYALRAGTATAVSGGVVDATEVRVNGTVVIDASGAVIGGGGGTWDDLDVPDALVEIAALSCSAGEPLVFDGVAWACGGLDAGALSAGTVDVARLPVGTGSAEIAAGDHGHSASEITSGTLDKAVLPALSAADVGAVPAGGGIPVGDATTCDTDAAGTLRWKTGALAICDGKAWQPVAWGVDGETPATAAKDCKALLAARPGLATGLYWLNPGSAGAFQAYCDMTTGGGGWTLIASQNAVYGDDMAKHFDEAVPLPGALGVRGWWMNNDLKVAASEIRVVNNAGETHTFKTADFDGPLKFNDANFVDAADQAWNGVIAGKNFPVVTHYQVGQACSGASCRKVAGSSNSYTFGFGIIFDWHNNDGTTNPSQHAHFGGTANIESSWARRGTELWIR